jgi:hypothetical protein
MWLFPIVGFLCSDDKFASENPLTKLNSRIRVEAIRANAIHIDSIKNRWPTE